MIPKEIRLTNFMSYKYMEEPLSFSTIHTAVLCGKNGHGKSSLLDAMTWALWGRARGIDKKGSGTDDLIYHKQNHMQVEFSFELEGNTYRVIRSRALKGKTGTTRLEFQLIDNGTAKPLTGESITQTQEIINRTLRIDYDTFINSAFIMQGKADLFMVKSANERKEILAEILGLSIYDELEELSKEKRKERNERLKAIDDQIYRIDEESGKIEILEQDLDSFNKQLVDIQEKIKINEAELNRLKKDKAIYDIKRTQYEEFVVRIMNSQREIKSIEDQLNKLQENLKENQLIIDKSSEIEKGYIKLKTLREQEEKLAILNQKHAELQKQSNLLNVIIEKEKNELESKLKHLLKRQSELRLVIDEKSNLDKMLSDNRNKIKEFEKIENDLEKMRNKYLELKNEIVMLNTNKTNLEGKLQELIKRKELLTDGESCPLCRKPLEINEIAKLRQEFDEEIKKIENEIQNLDNLIARKKSEQDALEKDGQNAKNTISEKTNLQQKEGSIIEKLKQIEQATQELSDVNKEINNLNLKLSQNIYAEKEQSEFRQIQEQLKEINYDPSEHTKVRSEIKNLAQYEDLKAKLASANATITAIENTKIVLEKQKESLINAVKEDETKLSTLESELKNIEHILKDLSNIEEMVTSLQKSKTEIIDKRAVISAKIDAIKQLREEKKKFLEDYKMTAYEAKIYDLLATAFGKKGIQALIIENTIPEIEEEANSLLRKLTNNQMSLRFATQKSKRSGDAVETLDLIISDGELGDRKYELFSGGEAFRINFAVRLALSKLLARRAGARLETLIIDEGFGTQDDEGKELLIDAISAIQKDFKKIIIITHLDELKEFFPARIEVEKKRGIGSIARVV